MYNINNLITKNDADDFVAPKCHEDITLLYQDEYLLVINKPSGLLSLSGKNPLNKDSVHYRLVQDFPTALMVHRLDFGTSGVMVIALNKQVNSHLTKQFQCKTIDKRYIAVLHGNLAHERGEIRFKIAKSVFPRQKICEEQGKSAVSGYSVIARDIAQQVTRVEFIPKTGRTHQLRVHSQGIGHPILGCDLYANQVSQSLAERLLLHASEIEFAHPITEKRIQVFAPCPF